MTKTRDKVSPPESFLQVVLCVYFCLWSRSGAARLEMRVCARGRHRCADWLRVGLCLLVFSLRVTVSPPFCLYSFTLPSFSEDPHPPVLPPPPPLRPMDTCVLVPSTAETQRKGRRKTWKHKVRHWIFSWKLKNILLLSEFSCHRNSRRVAPEWQVKLTLLLSDWHLAIFPSDEAQCKPMGLFVTNNLLSSSAHLHGVMSALFIDLFPLSESTAQSATNQPKSLLICFYRYWYCLKTFWNNVIEIIPYSPEPIQRLYTANLMWHAISVSQTIASPQVPVFNEQPFGCEPVCVRLCVCQCV